MTWPTKTDFVDGDVLTAAQVNNIGTNLNVFDPTSATSGQVPVADGAGSAAWGSAGGMTVITSGSIPAAASFSLTSIPTTYNRLVLYLNDFRVNTGAANIWMRLNGNTGTTYRLGVQYVDNGGYSATSSTFSYYTLDQVGLADGKDQQLFVELDQYTPLAYHPVRSLFAGQKDGSPDQNATTQTFGMYYDSSAAITQIDIALTAGSFTQGTYTLYGMA